MSTVIQTNLISTEEYLQGELASEVKHELIDGYAYAMAGAHANHERISGNVYAEIRQHLKNFPCEPFGSDMKVKTGLNFFYLMFQWIVMSQNHIILKLQLLLLKFYQSPPEKQIKPLSAELILIFLVCKSMY